MKIETFINHGTMIEIESVQTMNLHIDKGQVCFGEHGLQEVIAADVAEAEADTPVAQTADGQLTALIDSFTDEQVRASGIRLQARVVLALITLMQPQCKQKVDWLSFYSVLLNRRWVDDNVRAWCRMVEGQFGVSLDPRTLANDLTGQGSNDYRLWTDADRRIVRRKQLAAEFDNRLAEYFERGRSAVLQGVR
ncbi:MAG: hypothetical protein IJ977_10485 [Fibrobacter sp.]|nr:hypothetical protein [Fibrobacter sp.]MBR6621167.1 hypothetical protein [Bacteroides sp.]